MLQKTGITYTSKKVGKRTRELGDPRRRGNAGEPGASGDTSAAAEDARYEQLGSNGSADAGAQLMWE